MGCLAGPGDDIPAIRRSLEETRVTCGPPPQSLFTTALPYPVFAANPAGLTTQGRQLVEAACPGFQANSVSRTVLFALSAVAEGLTQAGIDLDRLRSGRVGIALGTTVGCTFHDEEYYIAWRQGLAPDLAPVRSFLGGNVAAAVHRILGTKGPSVVVTNACASGTDAIGIARNWLRQGHCDFALAGGADELSRVAYNGFVSLMLSDESPCRPFNGDRQGLNLGEGAGVLILEREDDCRKRHGRPVGRILGYGCGADAYHPTAPHPEGRGLQNALRQALGEAAQPGVPALINAHGTGTKANDLAETTALARIFPGKDRPILVSTKGLTGHTLGAAGGIEAILTLVALSEGVTPGTVGCRDPDPHFAYSPLVQGITRPLSGRWGLSQSLAFGGGNSALVLEVLT
ncbi:MAG: beta-ketoacyl-[acyl-carrier-protein] synthase family protein [Proteobacteria bacterium]|nr:beta-ketoacyl-[acyl-carrier-protein] synthase family protein [Pseudomonadota bacterium]MBU1685855.1 beta-ketoacyl-[acyl-carrier-protein] synthase family protein [Pseudomonadota bacterium]